MQIRNRFYVQANHIKESECRMETGHRVTYQRDEEGEECCEGLKTMWNLRIKVVQKQKKTGSLVTISRTLQRRLKK